MEMETGRIEALTGVAQSPKARARLLTDVASILVGRARSRYLLAVGHEAENTNSKVDADKDQAENHYANVATAPELGNASVPEALYDGPRSYRELLPTD